MREESFLERYPYYVALLARMDAVADPSVQRMAVSTNAGRFYLHVNVESFVEHPEYLRGVLLHEVHHVALGHLTHPKFADPEEPDLMELAVEMSATIQLTSPPGTNYDVFVYLNTGSDVVECTTPRASGTSTGTTDQAHVTWGESGTFSNGNDDSRTVSIEVRPVSGPCSASAPYQLVVFGDL